MPISIIMEKFETIIIRNLESKDRRYIFYHLLDPEHDMIYC